MPSIREAFAESIDHALDARTTVVLPSELAADFWRRELVRSGIRTVVHSDRIVSWDRFKETAFDLRTDRPPANRTIRSYFVQQALGENARAPYLRRLVPPQHAVDSESARAHLARILPAIPRAAGLGRLDVRLEPLLADLAEIESRYKLFLNEHGLYEPAWLERAPAYQGGNHLLVMPELAEDFPEFADALSSVSRTSVPSRADRSLPRLELYDDAQTELESTLGRIAALLDGGTPTDSIVLTVADLESVRRRLVDAAELAAVPISVRQGVPLAESGPGRFFAAITDVVSSGFALASVKRLALNRAVPWLDAGTNARLILAGARAGCLGGENRPDRRWLSIPDSPERALIATLIEGLPPLVRARSAADLRLRLLRLLPRVIDRDGWASDDERILQRCMDELRSLADTEESLGIKIDAPYRFWLDRLSEQLYVPRDAGAGIPVLPYRVGAGMGPEHHFVVNLTSTSTRVRLPRYPFLTEAERDSIGDRVADLDLSDEFLRAYALSGRSVVMSGSKATWDGPALAPGSFVSGPGLVAATPAASPMVAWRVEADVSSAPPNRVYRLQREGSAAYVRGARPLRGAGRPGRGEPPDPDLTRDPLVDPELIQAALAPQRRAGGDLVSLSAADIDAFRACPFGYLLSRVLGLQDLDHDVDPDSARDIGSLFHAVLEEFYRELHDADERFDPERSDAYLARMQAIYAGHPRRARGMVPGYVWDAMTPSVTRIFTRVLAQDAALIAGHRLDFVEEWEHASDPQLGAALVGRVDRVSRAPSGALTLVDYKKRSVPSKKAISADAAEPTGVSERAPEDRIAEGDALGSVQIPFYVSLLESTGERVGAAAYYSLEDGKMITAFADEDDLSPAMTRERLDEILVLVGDIVNDTVRRAYAGDYRCEATCDGCAFRGVCRTRFVVAG